jgi:polysaccharide export outer membrane protein
MLMATKIQGYLSVFVQDYCKVIFLILIAFFTFNAPLHAQEGYRIGPGDVLSIEVFGEKDLSGDFTVSQDGNIKNILLGDVNVNGLTTTQIEQLLTQKLGEDYLVNPKVSVAVKEYRSHKVYVLGEVEKPGTYALTTQSRLLDILLKAGGPTSNAGDNVSILRRENGTLEHIKVDITRLFVEGDLSQNIPIKDGDIIYVSREEKGNITSRFYEKKLNLFYVVGEVKSPGAYELHEGYTVMNAILQAGGFTDYAKKNGVMLVRYVNGKREVFHVKMGDVMDKGELSKDMRIQASDLIIVPESLF